MPKEHIPVLLEESISALNIKPEGRYVDLTLGNAGHFREIVKRVTKGDVLGCDLDPDACSKAEAMFAENPRISIVNANFKDLDNFLYGHFDGAIMDLGCSTEQLTDPNKGFSFSYSGPLNMRFGANGLTALEILRSISVTDLNYFLKHLADERHSLKISRAIKANINSLRTTGDLAALIWRSIGKKERKHPATRSFQAIRMLVNQELNNLHIALPKLLRLLKTKGRLVIIGFHSVEHRMIKHFIRFCTTKNHTLYGEGSIKAIYIAKVFPTYQEVKRNISSRSAQMYVLEII